MGRRMHHRATRLGERHAAGDGHNLLETVDYLPRSQSSDQRHRPVSVPSRLPSQRIAGDVGDACEVDWLGWFDASGPLPHLEISDSDRASKRRQVYEYQAVFDGDGVRRAICRSDKGTGVLPLQLAGLGYGMLEGHGIG